MTKYFILLVLVFSLFLFGCTQSERADIQSDAGLKVQNIQDSKLKTQNQLMKGVSLSPRSFNEGDFIDFFAKAKQAGQIVSWVGDWNELGKEGGAPQIVAELSSTYGYTPLICIQFFQQSTGQLLRPLDDSTKQNYKHSLVEFAKKYKPKYIGIGVEVNVLYEKSQTDFDSFVQFYGEVYDAIKAESPDTRIFTIFQLEKMKGMNGGLFGGENNPVNSEWFLLDKFTKSDAIAFTSYPDLIYKNPSDIPVDYYSEIESHTTKPIVFTELGWHSAPSPKGWESSEEEQVEFVNMFFELSEDLNKEIVIWSFLYDQKTIEPFNTMGLFGNDGKPKIAWGKWISAD
ncbi:MAG: hypothetical protein ABII22_00135 [Candidatus Micrarchaeota archaeon]